ncbi:MAG: ATP-dependent DNA helicase RecQ [Christensenellales bacterium]
MDKLEALKQVFGHSAFRQGQEALIDALLSGADALGIMPTGAGKSVCYQIPALMAPGIALVISPLISLMKDQVTALIQAGVPAAYINSSLSQSQCALALQRAGQGHYKIIYVAPERLLTPSFLRFAAGAPLSLIAVDEAHCVSQWGQDFRPSYLGIADFIDRLPERPPVGAFTATATPQVQADILRLLRLHHPLIRATGFDRPGLYFSVRHPRDKQAELLSLLCQRPGKAGIVYCATRKSVDTLCDLLRGEGYAAQRYHAGLGDLERHQAQDDFQYDRAQVMVATNAFGMGIDKSNVNFVIHYNMPKNLESYYQEAGRAGRDGEPADCILLYGKQDLVLAKWMIAHGEVNPELDPAQREAVRRTELERLRQMNAYCTAGRCLRHEILKYFGEESPPACGNCSVCRHEAREGAAPKPPAGALRTAALQSGDELIFGGLRALRNAIARDRGIPAYAVFTDASLREMALRQPRTRADFLEISGVGDRKLESYGDLFLGLLRDLQTQDRDALRDSGHLSRLALSHYRASLPWSPDELRRLKAEVAQGMSLKAIALAHERPEGSVSDALRGLKLKTRF